MQQVMPRVESFAKIVVAGVGGAGGSALGRMIDSGLNGVEFIAINTDAQALEHSMAQTKINIGLETTRGLGAGADPSIGRAAAEESAEEIALAIQDADMVFVTLGAGGGTGSGAGPVVARIAHDLDKLVVAIVTKPFSYEGPRRMANAEQAIAELAGVVDTLITIPNDRVLQTIDRRTPLIEAFRVADGILQQGVNGISDLITKHGLINLDFADIKAIMKDAGSALMGIGRSSSDNRAEEAAKMAVESPLLDISIDGAKGVLFSVAGGENMSLHEINEAATYITSQVASDANIIFGATIDPALGDELVITLVAAGFDEGYNSRYVKSSPQVMHQQQQQTVQQQPLNRPGATAEPAQQSHRPHQSQVSQQAEQPQPYARQSRVAEAESAESFFDRPAFLRRRTRRNDRDS